MQINFTIPGQPVPLARARFGNGHTYEAKGMASSKSDVANAYLQAYLEAFGLQPEPHEGPVSLQVCSVFQQPKDFWEGRECTKKPDLDNLCKLVCDALNGVAYRDDSQITWATLMKRFGTRAETLVCITLDQATPKPAKRRKAAK